MTNARHFFETEARQNAGTGLKFFCFKTLSGLVGPEARLDPRQQNEIIGVISSISRESREEDTIQLVTMLASLAGLAR